MSTAQSVINTGLGQAATSTVDYFTPNYTTGQIPNVDPVTGWSGATTSNPIIVVVASSASYMQVNWDGDPGDTFTAIDPSTGYTTAALVYQDTFTGPVDEHEELGHGMLGLTDCSCGAGISLMASDISNIAPGLTSSDITKIHSDVANPVTPPPPPPCQ